MPSLAPNVVQMRRSGIRELMDLANTMSNVMHLEVGEPSFDTPAHVVEAAARAAREGYTHYTPNVGLPSLREKLALKLERVNKLHVVPNQIVVTPGAVAGLASALMTITEPGDEILIPDPGWPNYQMMVVLSGGVPKRYPLHEASGFLPDMALLEQEIGPRTKAMIINNPSNPAGAVFPRGVVRDLVHVARSHDLFLISDEVYEQIIFEGEHTSALSSDTDGRVISVYGFSKTYAMTGWRLGYVVASPEVAAAVGKLQEPLVSCASSVSQKAGEAAIDGPQDCVDAMVQAYRRRRDLAVRLLTELHVPYCPPSGAFYLMVDISARGTDSYGFSRALLTEAHVAVAPGETFGDIARNYVRISLAASDEQLAEGLRRLAAFLRV